MDEYVVLAALLLAGLLAFHFLLVKTLMPYLFPWLSARFANTYNQAMGSFKQELFKDMELLRENLNGEKASNDKRSLKVLEIGVGSGTNFKFYPDDTSVIAVEPKKNFVGYLEKSVAEHSPRVRLQRTVVAYAEDLRGHVEDCSVDAVSCTMVLCSVRDVEAVLSEAKRVLKPGGKFFYLEHVAGESGAFVRKVQWLLAPLWSYIFDGCQLMRTPWVNFDRAGFSKTNFRRFHAPLNLGAAFYVVEPHVMGVATK